MFVRAAGLTVHVQVEGPPGAPAVLLLHSLGTSLHVWDAQAAALSRSFRIIRPDMRGHGLTEVTSGPYAIEGLAADALAVLNELGVGRVHVAGLSIGGLIAQAVASLAPERVISLMLCDTAMVIPPPEGWHTRAAAVRAKGMSAIVDAVMARWVTPGFMETPAAIGLRAMLLRTDPEGYAGAAEAIAAEDRTAATHALRVPALVVVGDKDEATPPAFARALCDAISGARLVVLENAAHIPTIERPDAVSEALLGFLSPAVDDFYEAGMDVRRQVLGEAHVARSVAAITDLDRDFQRFITRTAWGGVWTRPGLDRRTRALLTMAMMAALGHHEEFRLHIRASPNSGTTPADIAEMLIQVAAYAGIPAANSAVRIAKETLKEMEGTKG